MTRLNSFPYIANSNSRVLILGSMPGQKSLDEDQYYAHPRNVFWQLMANIFNFNHDLPYQEKCAQLLLHKVSLWDVMKHCERKGSLDSAIIENSIAANNFHDFLESHGHIQAILFNGQKAEKSFKRYVLPDLNTKVKTIALPSTSPAYAAMKFADKFAIWSRTINSLLSTSNA